jgi:3-hydroxybutyryl-CoA dehydrogenase
MQESSPIQRLGVVGAGTMGAGIAQISATAGIETTLYDISASVLDGARARIQDSLDRLVRRERITREEADATAARIHTVTSSDALRSCEAVIEAAPEQLELKRELFVHLDAVCPPPILLATNTSSLSVTEIANATRHPERCIGLHFFNPPVLMELVEVIPGVRSDRESTDRGIALTKQLGRTPVETRDSPGFIVNRVIRAFYLEALRLLDEGVADVATIDRILKVGGGFPMGPFELIDLVGVDVNLAVSQTVFESFFQAPRFRPHLIQQQMVRAKLLGRKTDHGFYEYVDGKPTAKDQPATPSREVPQPVAIDGTGPLVDALRTAAREAGITLTDDLTHARLVIGAAVGAIEIRRLAIRKLLEVIDPACEVVVHCGPYSCTELVSTLRARESVAGFNFIGEFGNATLIELARGWAGRPSAVTAGEAFFAALGKATAQVNDSPGMVLSRITSCIANEGLIALHEGLATREAIDTAVKLGANHSRGPLDWAELIGLDTVLQTLRTLQTELGDTYAPAPRLRRLVQSGATAVE